MILHKREERSLLSLGLWVEHPGKAELRVQAAEEAVEGGGGGRVAKLAAHLPATAAAGEDAAPALPASRELWQPNEQ